MTDVFKESRKNSCGLKIKDIRCSLGLSQDSLAARLQILGLEISGNGVSKIELGQRHVYDYEISIFAEALNVPPETLL